MEGLPRCPTVVVVDFGGQYAHLITKAIRSLGVYACIAAPGEFRPEAVPDLVGIVLSGGPASVAGQSLPDLAFDPLNLSVPVLGICFGHQLLARLAGGRVAGAGLALQTSQAIGARPRGVGGEYGMAEIRWSPGAVLAPPDASIQPVWMSHADSVVELPPGFGLAASSKDLPVAAFARQGTGPPILGIQFHPEVHHTVGGEAILDRFLSLCTTERRWDPGTQERQILTKVRAEAGNRRVFLLLSGGVDSLVTLAVCVRALGPDNVHGIHVDTGFMRKDESDAVMGFLGEMGVRNVRKIDASRPFFAALEGVIDPEEKRRILGRLFVEVVEREMPEGGGWVLAQGTIYPDTIESGGPTPKPAGAPCGSCDGGAATIKTHHNRVDEIRRWIAEGRVVEPLTDLYKHEVRALGLSMGLPPQLVHRHPFPGPGLAVRILCSKGVPDETDDDPLLHEMASQGGCEARILPIRSVGVQGDCRTFRHPAALWRAEALSSDWAAMTRLATRITNQVSSVNRVILHLGGTRPPDLALAPLLLDRASVGVLQEADAIVHGLAGGIPEIWQMPVVLLPLRDPRGRPAIVLRPVRSRDAMTAEACPIPQDLLGAIWERLADQGIGALFIDLSSKPPATIEWE